MLLVDERNPQALALCAALTPHLDIAALPASMHLVIGGDGWMLNCIHQHGPTPTYLGLNAGHLGFLLNDVKDPAVVGAALMARRWRAWRFPLLKMEATCPDGTAVTARAVNDIYVERMTGQTVRLRIEIDEVAIVERMVCDGLLTATALGSTAYTYSAGGVPCHPLIRGIQVTPICPHAPRLSPVMLPHNAVVEVQILDAARRPARAVSDGIDHGAVTGLVVKTAGQEVSVGFLEGHHFTRTMIRKVLSS